MIDWRRWRSDDPVGAWAHVVDLCVASARNLTGGRRGGRIDFEDVAQQALQRLFAQEMTDVADGVYLRALVGKFVWHEFSRACRAAERTIGRNAMKSWRMAVMPETNACDLSMDFAAALHRCTDTQAIIMRELVEGKSVPEVADRLGCSPANVAQVRRRFLARHFSTIFSDRRFETGSSRFFST